MNLRNFVSNQKNKPTSENPYIRARGVWNLHTGAVLQSRAGWQTVAVLSLLIVLAVIGGFIKMAMSSQFIPYVIKMDELGRVEAVNPAQSMITQEDRERIYKAYVSQFISDARIVTPDVSIQTKAIHRVYAMINGRDPSFNKMNEFYNKTEESTPFRRAEKETVSIEIISALRQSESSWQVEWTETVRERDGHLKEEPYRMRALLNVYDIPPTNKTREDDMLMNPLGVFIKDYDWSKQN